MADADARFGEEFLDLVGRFVDGLDAVVDEEGLAVAGEFAEEGVLDEFVSRFGDDAS